ALLLRAAKTLDPLDPQLARDTYLDAWSSALFAGRLASSGSLRHVSRAALALGRAATGFAGSGVSAEEVLRWGWLATAAAAMAWDYDTCRTVAARGVEMAREAGALGVLAVSVNVMAQAVVLGGEFGTAAALVGEAE